MGLADLLVKLEHLLVGLADLLVKLEHLLVSFQHLLVKHQKRTLLNTRGVPFLFLIIK
ncbi:hypothetical protein [Peribacillus sp. NPDC060253]|uniref:hypothetical protein n=1 Tax=Peribacillus sp. NPDC060253 TaxID=3347084 RepID=UPI003669FD08